MYLNHWIRNVSSFIHFCHRYIHLFIHLFIHPFSHLSIHPFTQSSHFSTYSWSLTSLTTCLSLLAKTLGALRPSREQQATRIIDVSGRIRAISRNCEWMSGNMEATTDDPRSKVRNVENPSFIGICQNSKKYNRSCKLKTSKMPLEG